MDEYQKRLNELEKISSDVIYISVISIANRFGETSGIEITDEELTEIKRILTK